jgi:hypothetical protein
MLAAKNGHAGRSYLSYNELIVMKKSILASKPALNYTRKGKVGFRLALNDLSSERQFANNVPYPANLLAGARFQPKPGESRLLCWPAVLAKRAYFAGQQDQVSSHMEQKRPSEPQIWKRPVAVTCGTIGGF